MWVRKRIDIGWPDMARATAYCVTAWSSRRAEAALGRAVDHLWPEQAGGAGRAIAVSTERSGFDLLLATLALPSGSEVLISAVTIEDMAKIVRAHGLVATPVDVCPRDMSVSEAALEAAVTPQTRAVLFAHLFGTRVDVGPLVAWARGRDLLFWEDCAQAFEGAEYAGHPGSDAVLFSFGPIKTATALGGGLLLVRDADLRRRVRDRLQTYPAGSRRRFAKRVAVTALLKALATRWAFSAFVAVCGVAGWDYDRALNASVRNVPDDDFFAALRRRPTPPLLRLIARRFRAFDARRLETRRRRGALLTQLLGDHEGLTCPGGAAPSHSHWVFPVGAARRGRAVEKLRRAGFDATTHGALGAVDPPGGRLSLRPVAAEAMLASMFYVPAYAEMPESEIRRLAEVLRQMD